MPGRALAFANSSSVLRFVRRLRSAAGFPALNSRRRRSIERTQPSKRSSVGFASSDDSYSLRRTSTGLTAALGAAEGSSPPDRGDQHRNRSGEDAGIERTRLVEGRAQDAAERQSAKEAGRRACQREANVCAIDARAICRSLAPSAIRTPISRVRLVTKKDVTAYTPVTARDSAMNADDHEQRGLEAVLGPGQPRPRFHRLDVEERQGRIGPAHRAGDLWHQAPAARLAVRARAPCASDT